MSEPASRLRVTLVLLALLCPGSLSLAQQQPGAGQSPPPAVVVERVEVRGVGEPEEFTARVEAIESVDIRARVQGTLTNVAFEAGQFVQVGDLLFEIDPEQYQAALASAQADLARAEAARKAARRALARTRELAERGTASQAELDQAQADFDMANADVEVARAALRRAELDLSYTRITSPIAGQIGQAFYTRGNLVGPESGPLAHVVQLDPVRVVFSVATGLVVTLRQQQAGGSGIDPKALNLTLRLPNGTDYMQAGRLEYVGSEVNPQTGTVPVRVIFPNPDRLLIPNQQVTLFAREEELPRRPVVPQTAVLQDREGRYVYLLGENDTVARRRIETGERVGNGWAVTRGLSGGERVVVQGIQRLSEGMRVRPTGGDGQ